MNQTYILQGTAVQWYLSQQNHILDYPQNSCFHLNPVQYTFSQSMILASILKVCDISQNTETVNIKW